MNDFEIHHTALLAVSNLSNLVSLIKARNSKTSLGLKAQEALAYVIHESHNLRRCLADTPKKKGSEFNRMLLVAILDSFELVEHLRTPYRKNGQE